MKRLALFAWLLLGLGILSCRKQTPAPSSAQPAAHSTEDTDPGRRLQALNEAAFAKLASVMRWLDENDPKRKNSSPDEPLNIEAGLRDELRNDLAAADTQEKRVEVLNRNLEVMIYVINDNLGSAVDAGLTPPPPVPVTMDTLEGSLQPKK